MAILFNDDLEGYTIGQDPFGSFLDIGFFKGQITTDVFNRNVGTRVYQMGLNGQILFHFSSVVNKSSVYWVGVNTPSFVFGQSTATDSTNPGINFATFQV